MSQTYARRSETSTPPNRLNRAKERMRLATLAGLELLDTPPEKEFDAVVSLAREALGCKVGLISLIDDKRLWFKAKAGIGPDELPRDQSFCSYALEVDDMLVVPDATLDPRFEAYALTTGKTPIRFYAGVPLKADIPGMGAGSAVIGTLCVADTAPHWLTHHEAQVLRKLAQYAETLIRERHAARQAARHAQERDAILREADLRGREIEQAQRMAKICSWRLTLADMKVQSSDNAFELFDEAHDSDPGYAAAMEHLPPETRTRIDAAVQRVIHQQQGLDEEAEFVTRLGNRRRIRILGQLELRDGKPFALLGVTQDITDRLAPPPPAGPNAARGAATFAPADSRQLLALVERTANIGTWRISAADWKVEWSEQMFAIHGLPVGDPPTLDTAMNYYAPDTHALLTGKLFHSISSGEPYDVVADIVGAGGRNVRVRCIGEVELSDGRPVALVGLMQDITERGELEVAPRATNVPVPISAAAPDRS